MTERIVENLVANARKYSPPGTPIDVTVTETATDAVLIVEDRGPGVPDVDKTLIFDPFHRLDHADPQPGVGLGLALVQRFAQLQGGDVSVEDRDGGGSTFTVTFPKGGMSATDGEPALDGTGRSPGARNTDTRASARSDVADTSLGDDVG